MTQTRMKISENLCKIYHNYYHPQRAIAHIKKIHGNSAALNAVDNHQNTPLLIAAKDINTSLMTCLLKDACVDVNSANDQGLTALHILAKGNWSETRTSMLSQLIQRSDLAYDMKNASGHTPLQTALMVGNLECAKVLLSKPNQIGINSQDIDGQTALHHAAILQGMLLFQYHDHSRQQILQEVVQLMLSCKGVDTAIKDKFGKTAFDYLQEGWQLNSIAGLLTPTQFKTANSRPAAAQASQKFKLWVTTPNPVNKDTYDHIRTRIWSGPNKKYGD